MSITKVVVSLTLFLLLSPLFAMIDKQMPQITPRHFTIAPPFSISTVEAHTNIPNFSVVQTSDNTFDVYFDYIYPTPRSHGSVKLWVMNGKDTRDAWFVNDEIGIQFLECTGCPRVNKIEPDHYQFTFEWPLSK